MGMTEGPCTVTLRVVKGNTRTEHSVEVDLTSPVWNAKGRLEGVVGIPQLLQLWSMQGTELDDDEILGEYVRKANAVIEVTQEDD